MLKSPAICFDEYKERNLKIKEHIMPPIIGAKWKPFTRQIQQFAGGPEAARSWIKASRIPLLLSHFCIKWELGNDTGEENLFCHVKDEFRIDAQLAQINVSSLRSDGKSTCRDELDLETGKIDKHLGCLIASLNRLENNLGFMTQNEYFSIPDQAKLSFSRDNMCPEWVTPGLKDLLAHLRLYAIAKSLDEICTGFKDPGRALFISPYSFNDQLKQQSGLCDNDETCRILTEILLSMAKAISGAPLNLCGNPLAGMKQEVHSRWNKSNAELMWFMNTAFLPLRPVGEGIVPKSEIFVLDLSPLADFLGFKPAVKS